MVVAVVLLHFVTDMGQDHGVWGIPGFVVISLLLVPVVYGAMSYGLVGALGPAVSGVILLAPSELWQAHTPTELWGGWSNLTVVVVIATLLGERFEFTRGVLVARTRRDVQALEEHRFRLAFDNNLSAMAVVDAHGDIAQINQAFCDLLNYTAFELTGMRLNDLFDPSDTPTYVSESKESIDSISKPRRSIRRLVRSDGRVITTELSQSAMGDIIGEEAYSMVSIRDITEERLLTARLTDLALHDSLTGLANRALLRDRLAQAHARADRDGNHVVLYLLDLDNFKGVNDTLGHVAGDELLIAVANRLRAVTRGTDTVSRLGGDEFVLLASGLSDEGAVEMANRLLDLFTRPFYVGGQQIDQTASIGVVCCGAALSFDCDDLIRSADIALYEAKRLGRARIVVYSSTMTSETSEHFQLSQELSHAVSRSQIVMHFQPVVDLQNHQVVAFEALMRWIHPTRGFVPPEVFIPLAEQSDLILELGVVALEQASAAVVGWRADGAQWRVGINLATRQVNDPGLLDLFDGVLARTGLGAESLVVEITENIAIADLDVALRTLDGLRQRGVAVWLDDFGTGYSSLAYVARLRPSTIKIDRSFVHAATSNVTDRNVLAAVVTLCRQLGMIVLAEGVETTTELELLIELGVDLAQGFLFSPPVPASEIQTAIRSIASWWSTSST